MERLPRKLAIVTHIVAPASAGSAMRYFRLLKDTNPDDYCLLLSRDFQNTNEAHPSQRGLPAIHYRLPIESLFLSPPYSARRRPVAQMINHFLRTLQRARNISGFVRRERCQAILALSGDLHDLPAGYLASLWHRIPFYAAVDDFYSYQWTDPVDRRFARLMEPRLLKGSAGVLVINEFIRDEYQARYQIDPLVVYNPCESTPGLMRPRRKEPASSGEIAIVYTGSIYHANYDAFENLVKATRLLDRPGIRIHLYAEQPADQLPLEQRGICGPVVLHGGVSPEESLAVQSRADILFLPLGFDSGIQEVIKTSMPFKMGEYMASGSPILVHAPAETFVTWYMKKHECGVVVDQSNPEHLAMAIGQLLDDATLRHRLTANALAQARSSFSLLATRGKFMKLFEPNNERTRCGQPDAM